MSPKRKIMSVGTPPSTIAAPIHTDPLTHLTGIQPKRGLELLQIHSNHPHKQRYKILQENISDLSNI